MAQLAFQNTWFPFFRKLKMLRIRLSTQILMQTFGEKPIIERVKAGREFLHCHSLCVMQPSESYFVESHSLCGISLAKMITVKASLQLRLLPAIPTMIPRSHLRKQNGHCYSHPKN